jgi:PAS domain S-box-containing protein
MNKKREGEFQHNPALKAQSKISCAESGQTDEDQNPLQEGGYPHNPSAYQLGLEQQNDALKENQIKLEKTLAHYVDLFDFAPVGYLYLDEKGSILEINLTAAKLLAQDRKNIINRPFIHLIPDEFKNLWDRHFLLAKQAEGKYGCELPFDFGNGATLYYHLDCVFIHEEQGVPHVRITLTDVTERKQVEMELRIAAVAFETQEAIIVVCANKIILRVNKAFSRITGYDVEEARGLAFLNSKRHDSDFYRLIWADVIEKGYWQGELSDKRKNGELFHMSMTISAITNKESQITHYVVVFTDITERKLVEEKFFKLNRDFNAFLDNTSDHVYFKDTDNRFSFCSQSLATIAGQSRWQDMVGKTMFDLFPKELANIYHQGELPVFRDGIPLKNHLEPFIDEQGNNGWVSTSKWPQFDSDGNIVGIFGISRDITAQKNAEEVLRIAAAAFEVQESIIVTNADKLIQRVNKAFTRITGYTSEDAVGKSPSFLRSGLHDAKFYQGIYDCLERDGFWHGEIWDKRKNGDLFPALQTISAVKDEAGQVTHYVGAMIDNTAQKQAEKVLIEARERLENQVINTQEELDKNKQEMAQINTALNVLLKNRESDKAETQVAFSNEVENTVLPLLKKLKGVSANRHQSLRLLKVLEANLQDLAASYGRTINLSAAYQKLTPVEIQVASMIRQGQPTKTIASALNIAPGTVNNHRKHIRKKLGLDGKPDNLHSHLKSLVE